MTTVEPTDITLLEGLGERWAKAWQDLDGDAVAALCSDALIYDEPALGATRYGREEVRAHVISMAEAFSDHSFELVGLFMAPESRAMVVAWHFEGTVVGTDQQVSFHGDDRLEVGEDGLIHSYRGLYDNRFVRQQIKAALASARG
ncbi:nuclear transport factor 2 family protein [Streptomyces sp. NPDC002740]